MRIVSQVVSFHKSSRDTCGDTLGLNSVSAGITLCLVCALMIVGMCPQGLRIQQALVACNVSVSTFADFVHHARYAVLLFLCWKIILLHRNVDLFVRDTNLFKNACDSCELTFMLFCSVKNGTGVII